ncbi:MAG: hypothetical protein QOI50_297, partial [Pseudonocardiales bacterium]|nr:hypothetical protein [Pseudonocardiales bacterium]
MSGLVGSDGLVREWPGQPAGPPATNTMTREPKPPTN